MNVGLIMWELAVLPRSWLQALKVLDVVAAASDFCGSTFAARLGNISTISVPCPICLPEGIHPSRRRFALPKQGTLFITSFEPNSDIQRKNPYAAIEAFLRAFAGNTRAHLVIKLNNTKANKAAHALISELRRSCAEQGTIHIIEEVLSYLDVLSLYATCDAFVSLHRSEGLGLALMEAMALGKPVIATGWSGNMTFMDHTNSCLVGYDLIPVQSSLLVYRKEYLGEEAVWANPSIEQAAAWMRRLVDDPNLRLSIGKKAATDMGEYQRIASKAHFVEELRALWEQRDFLSPRHARRDLQVRHLWDAASSKPSSFAEKLKKQVHRSLEQHILWRFRA